jgi:hypothetical protein
LAAPVNAQKIRAEATLLLERLPLEKQQKLKDFYQAIETYISDYDWTGEVWDQEIPLTIQIYLQDHSVSYESRYAGTFLITNNLDIQYYDKYWRFPYQDGERLFHQEGVFDPLTGFMEFYVYLILGGEYDKQGRLLGTPYFEKAKYIAEQAQFNSQFILGWDERNRLIDRILSDEYKPFREMVDLFFLGMSYVGEADTTARRYCNGALDVMDRILRRNPDHPEALQFMKAHHLEYIDLFKGDEEMLRRLMDIDRARAETYEKYIEN